jgi:biopolymer transport protein ExbD
MKMGAHFGVNFESKMDMTPLIDCIFQLILFLVLTSQINIQAADVDLPFALEGKESDKIKDEVPPLIVNVVRRTKGTAEERAKRLGDIIYGGNIYDQKKLTAELKKEVYSDAVTLRKRGYEVGPAGKQLSKLAVLVRADKDVRSEYIRTIFMACQEAGIYRVRVSSTTPQ